MSISLRRLRFLFWRRLDTVVKTKSGDSAKATCGKDCGKEGIAK